jgi:hypothetical protein
MTYNFDADRWYEREWSVLKARRQSGALSQEDFEAASEALNRRYDEMVKRLDGTYHIPSPGPRP